MKKYIGHESGLIGPVEMEKPETQTGFPYDKIQYDRHISSLPVIPCEGWVPEVGKEYVEGVDFMIGTYPDCNDFFCEIPEHWPEKAYPLPLPAAPQEGAQDWSYICKHRDFAQVLENNWQAQISGYYNYDKTDEEKKIRQAVITEYEDLIAIYKEYQKALPAANDGGDGWKLDYKFLQNLTKKVNDSEWGEGLSMEQVESVVIAYKQSQSQTYPAEFVEWVGQTVYAFVKGKGWVPDDDSDGWETTGELFQYWNDNTRLKLKK